MTFGIQDFDFSVDLLRTLLWQYNDAQRLQNLLTTKQNWYAKTQTKFWQDWYKNVFNLDTANEFGLSVWAIILEVPLNVGVRGTGARIVWGYGNYNGNYSRWDGDQSKYGTNFGRDGDDVFKLTTEQKRLVLKLRYFQLTSRGSVPEVNAFLRGLFGENVWVLDNLDMSFTYYFGYVPSAEQMLILTRFDLLPRPAGVERKIIIAPENSFGFDPYYLNFENGNFHT